MTKKDDTALPKPVKPADDKADDKVKDDQKKQDDVSSDSPQLSTTADKKEDSEAKADQAVESSEEANEATEVKEKSDEAAHDESEEDTKEDLPEIEAPNFNKKVVHSENTTSTDSDNQSLEKEVKKEATTEEGSNLKDDDLSSLAQFAKTDDVAAGGEDDLNTQSTKDISSSKTTSQVTISSPQVIKNKSGVGSMLKMVFISVAVFFATVGIGVGLGLGFIKLSQQNDTKSTEFVAQVEPEETKPVEVSPTPSPKPEIKKSETSILVVNATTKAGYAGKIKALLETDGFEDVEAGNAKGDYEDASLVLMKKENKALIDMLSEASDIDFDFSDEIEIEDPDETYDAVIVLVK